MAKNRFSRIGSLIDGFNSMYDTIGRVQRDMDLREVATAKPEEVPGEFPEQSPEAVQQSVAAQMADGAGGAEAVKIARASAGPRAAPSFRFLGQTQATPFDDGQMSRARQLAMASTLEKHGDVEGGSRLRSQVQQLDMSQAQLAEMRARGEREGKLFPLQLGAAERGERVAAQTEADMKATRDAETQAGEWFKQRMTNADGTMRPATVDDHLAASQYRASLFAQQGRPDLAGKAIDEHNARALVKINLETAQRGEAVNRTAAALAAGDLNAVRDFYNQYVPDGARVTDVKRDDKGRILVQRETADGRPMSPTVLKDTGQMLAALNTFKDPMALYNWSQNEFRNNLSEKADARADKAEARADRAEGRAGAAHAAGAPERALKGELARLQLAVVNARDEPTRAQAAARLAQVSTALAQATGAGGEGGGGADPADVKKARALVAAAKANGQELDLGTALETIISKPDQAHQEFIKANLKELQKPEDAVKNADTVMASMGWRRSGNRWTKIGAQAAEGPSFASEAEAEAAAKAKKIKPGDRITINGQTGTWK